MPLSFVIFVPERDEKLNYALGETVSQDEMEKAQGW